MKLFVTALDKESATSTYLLDFFPKLSEAKFKSTVFVGPQIKMILEWMKIPKDLTKKEEADGNSFLSEAKFKSTVFAGPQIKMILECKEIPKDLTKKEEADGDSFVAVVQGFHCNHKAKNYVELIEMLVKIYGTMGCWMSSKVLILDNHHDKFKEIMGVYSKEQGESFHKDPAAVSRAFIAAARVRFPGRVLTQPLQC
ncbi:uncharacterized protein LOC119261597 [Tachysurus ichikawai]